MKIGRLIIGAIMFLAIYMLFGALIYAETMNETYSGLWFTLTHGSAMLPGTVTDPAQTKARVDLKIMEGYTVDPIPKLTGVVAKFTYDANKWNLLLNECVRGPYWPEQYYFDVFEDPLTPGGGIHTVTITLSNTTGVDLPFPPHNKVFAVLYFEALPVCQNHGSSSLLDLLTEGQECTVEINNQTWVPSNPEDGSLTIATYLSTTAIGSESLFRLIDQTPTVNIPVTIENNFKFRGFENLINYDPDKLEFLGATLEEISNLVWDGNPPEAGVRPISIKVTNSSGDFAEQNNQVFYTLQFRLKQWWEGIGTDITFEPTGNIYHIYVNGSECTNLSSGPFYVNVRGTVTSEAYHADLTAGLYPNTEILAKNGNHNALVLVKMSDNFPAGISNDAIEARGGVLRFNLNRKNASGQQVWTIGNAGSYIVGCDPDFNFNNQTYAQNEDAISILHEAAVNQQFGWIAPQPDPKSLVWFNLQLNPDNFSPVNFDNRKVPLNFVELYGTNPAQVRDMTGHVYAQHGTSPRRLDWTTDSIDVVMGEFYGVGGSSENTSISRPIYLRNNFPTAKPVTSFSATVSVNNSFTIGTVIPNTVGGTYNITYSRTNAYTIVLNFTANPTSIPAADNPPFKIADVTFNVGGCPAAKVQSDSPGPGAVYRSATVSILSTNCSISNSDGVQYRNGKNFNVTCKCNGGTPIEDDPYAWKEAGLLPTEFMVHPNYPNPFNPETVIKYDVPSQSHVSLKIFNILGQEVATLVDEPKQPGRYEVVWRGTNTSGQQMSTGVYLCVMKAGNYSGTVKMSLLK